MWGGKLVGSPPRVRGTVVTMWARMLADRITPACAGNSSPLAGYYRQD